MPLPSRHMTRKSSPVGLRPGTLTLGHGGFPQYWIITSERGGTFIFLWNLPELSDFGGESLNSPHAGGPQQTDNSANGNVQPVLVWCWPNVANVGPASNQHRISVTCEAESLSSANCHVKMTDSLQTSTGLRPAPGTSVDHLNFFITQGSMKNIENVNVLGVEPRIPNLNALLQKKKITNFSEIVVFFSEHCWSWYLFIYSMIWMGMISALNV